LKNLFRGYYAPNESELTDIWASALVVLDTNALLNLFRYSQTTRDEFLLVLQTFQKSLWIPHQVGLEFHRRRLDVINQQESAFDEIELAISAAKNDVSRSLKKFERHPSLNSAALTSALETGLAEIGRLVAETRKNHRLSIVDGREYDKTFELITVLYEECVGLPFTEQDLENLYDDGRRRYERKIPPGYKDADKPEPDRYGDLVLWKQIVARGTETQKPVIFVTDDAKEDWWYRIAGKTQGARIELVDEYFAASGQRIHFYSPDRFLSYAKERTGSSVSQESISEVEEVSARSTILAASVLQDRRRTLEDELARTSEMAARQRARSESGAIASSRSGEASGQGEIESLQSKLDSITTDLSLYEQLASSEKDLHTSRGFLLRAARLRADRERILKLLAARENSVRRNDNQMYAAQADRLHRRAAQMAAELREVESALEELGA